jgi:hypothetical protein
MDTPISKFLPTNTKTYLQEAADYLAARGLSHQEVPIVPLLAKNHGMYHNGLAYPLEGWAFRLRTIDGDLVDGQYLLRVCNWIEGLLDRNGAPADEPPKFLQTSKTSIIHYVGGRTIQQSPVVAIHEKFTAAELMWRHLRVPSVAISGCRGWSKNHCLNPELRQLFKSLADHVRIVVHFDGDIRTNENVRLAATDLMGEISVLRPDATVVIAQVPIGYVGWDDWWVDGATAQQWLDLLASEGIDVPDTLPLSYLRDEYGVALVEVGRHRTLKMEQSTSNYQRLLRFPKWAQYRWDFTGQQFPDESDFSFEFLCWMERTICRGDAASVNLARLYAATATFRRENTSNLVRHFLQTLPPPPPGAARAAALRIAELWPTHGPLQGEELIQTLLRMGRDILERWDGTSKAQWILSIVGPSGCGKTTAIERMMEPLLALGLRHAGIGQLPRVKQQLDQKEIVRILRDSRWALLDDLNHNMTEADARAVFNMLFAVSSGIVGSQREMRQEFAVMQPVHGILVTTSVNRDFIRTPRNTGERRFIVWEMRGQSAPGWAEAWCDLFTAFAHGATVDGDATEFSQRYVAEYVRDSQAHNTLATRIINWRTVADVMQTWHRPGRDHNQVSQPYRFRITMLAQAMGLDSRNTEIAELTALAEECGAVRLGQARVLDSPYPVRGVYGVTDAAAFLAALEIALL